MPNTKNILDIKVLGTATSGHQMAVSLINEYLDLANIAHKLEEVTDVSNELTQSTVVDVDFAQMREDYLNEFVEKMDLDWGSDLLKVGLIDKEFRTGFPGEEILDSAKENEAELIVMGTTGDSSRIKKWFGSVSTKIMNDAKIPVLLVPDGARYQGVANIMFAFDERFI